MNEEIELNVLLFPQPRDAGIPHSLFLLPKH